MGQYQLKKGVLLQAFGDASKTCTNDNLTDELAEWHLKQCPEKIIYFSKLPPGMQVIVDPPRQRPFLSMKDKARISTSNVNFQTNIVPPTIIIPPKIITPKIVPPKIIIPTRPVIPSIIIEPDEEIKTEVKKEESKKIIKKLSKNKK